MELFDLLDFLLYLCLAGLGIIVALYVIKIILFLLLPLFGLVIVSFRWIAGAIEKSKSEDQVPPPPLQTPNSRESLSALIVVAIMLVVLISAFYLGR